MPLRLLYFLLVIAFAGQSWAEGGIHLILSEAGPAHQEAAEVFRNGLDAQQPVRVWLAGEVTPELLRGLTRANDLIVPIGVRATRLVADHHAGQAAVLALMVPRSTGERLTWPARLARRKISFVFIDQPAPRAFDLVAAAFPRVRRIGVVISPDSAAVAAALGQEAGRRRLALNLEMVTAPEELATVLRRVLQESDLLLLVPDALVINAGNAQNVLLTAYRHRVLALGFSQGLAKAGAVAALYSSPAQIGRQGASMARRWLEGGDLPIPQVAGEFSLLFNPHVARSLGLDMPDENEVRHRIGAVP